MKVLVTGGAGYIGSHVVRALQESGHRVRVLDDLSTGHVDFLLTNKVEFVGGEVGDPLALEEALEGIDAVVHVAGRSLAPESVVDPGPYFDTNLLQGIELLEAMRRADVQKIVFSSTCAVYGEPRRMPIQESCRREPINPYGASKLGFERVLEAYRAYGLQTLCLRYFNVAGASARGDLGELHEPETHLIPNLLVAAERGTEFFLYGDDHPTDDGTCVRDYIHVEDLADAHVAAVEALDRIEDGTLAVNLGSGTGSSVLEVARAVEYVCETELNLTLAEARPGDAPCLIAKADRAKRLLGWSPRRDLTDMVASARRFLFNRLPRAERRKLTLRTHAPRKKTRARRKKSA